MCLFIETIRIENGRICNLDYHAARFNRTRAAFGKDSALVALSDMVSPPSAEGVYKCRVVYGEEIEEVTYAPYRMREVSSLRLIASDTIDYTYKSADRSQLNALFGQRGRADDVLIVRNGYLTDTSIANVALYDGNKWCTPAFPLLKGTKRAELLDKGLIVEREITWLQLGCFSRIMLFNALIDWERLIIPVDGNSLML